MATITGVGANLAVQIHSGSKSLEQSIRIFSKSSGIRMSEDRSEISGEGVAKLAYDRAKIAGEKEKKPRKGNRPKAVKQWFRRFNLSTLWPYSGEKPDGEHVEGVDNPNPDFTPASTNQAGKEAVQRDLERRIEAEQEDSKKAALRGILVKLSQKDAQELPPAPDMAPSETLLHELDDLQELCEDSETGQRFNRVYLNRKAFDDDPGRAVNVYSGLYLNVNNADDESRLRLLELARQMPNRALISFDYPGMGGSDPLKKELQSTKKADGFLGIADAELRILRDMGIRRINVFGISQGGFVSLALAARAQKYGIEVEEIIPIGAAGLEHMNLPKIGKRESKEGKQLELYHSSPHDPAMWQASHLENPGDRQSQPGFGEILEKDPMLRYARMMTYATAEEWATLALQTNPNAKLLLVNGSEDTVSRLKAATRVARSLKDRLRREGEDGKRVAQLILPGEGHLAGVHPKILAPIVKSQVEETFV